MTLCSAKLHFLVEVTTDVSYVKTAKLELIDNEIFKIYSQCSSNWLDFFDQAGTDVRFEALNE